MKKTITTLLIIISSLSTSIYAESSFAFITKKQALLYCPEVNQLLFKPYGTSRITNGTITARKNGKLFTSGTQSAMHPRHLNSNNTISDIKLRKNNGAYGYKKNNTVTCNYNYETAFLYNYPLVLSNALNT
ncbi:MAG: hypothetical protein P1U34_09555 [Coxiellaceae bacterium]|nr:hypothetical protein [Coxiellaceae bacterium]